MDQKIYLVGLEIILLAMKNELFSSNTFTLPCFCNTILHQDVINSFTISVCKIYEEHLKELNPSSLSITYDISQLFDFIDELADLACLIFNK